MALNTLQTSQNNAIISNTSDQREAYEPISTPALPPVPLNALFAINLNVAGASLVVVTGSASSSSADLTVPTTTKKTTPSAVEQRRVQSSSIPPSRALKSALSAFPLDRGHSSRGLTQHDLAMKEMIRRAYETSAGRKNNPFLIDRYVRTISHLEGMARLCVMLYSEGGPYHPHQVALRNAEPNPYNRKRMYQLCLLSSYNRMVLAHFGPQGEAGGAASSKAIMTRVQSFSNLLPKVAATLYNQDPSCINVVNQT